MFGYGANNRVSIETNNGRTCKMIYREQIERFVLVAKPLFDIWYLKYSSGTPTAPSSNSYSVQNKENQ